MKKNRGIAIALAFILGGFGVHKFYLRDPGSGVFYIILNLVTLRLFGFGAATVLGWIDAFRMLGMDSREFDRRYNWRQMRRNYEDVSRHRPSSRRHKDIQRRKERQRGRKRVRNNPYKKEGMKHFKEYDLPAAREAFQKALETSPNDGELHFYTACVYSLTEETEKALRHLHDAVANGFKDTERIHSHDALAFVRIQPAFETFVKNNYTYDGKKPVETDTRKDKLPDLDKLKELREKGLITELEYIREKQKLSRS